MRYPKGKLITIEEAKVSLKQHKLPCSDCPFRKDALQGWLGGNTPEQYLALALSDQIIDCHTKIGPQCAGTAIFRANICKSPRDKRNITLSKNTVKVFASTGEFLTYHNKG